jgi:hypothetical protein
MERVLLGEDSTCTECERVLWHGEPARCASTRAPDCLTLCNRGLECAVLCEARLRRLLTGQLYLVGGSQVC